MHVGNLRVNEKSYINQIKREETSEIYSESYAQSFHTVVLVLFLPKGASLYSLCTN
jgi:hypothetical protein